MNHSFSGMAVFASDILAGGAFGIVVEDGSGNADVGFVRPTGSRLTPGTYPLGGFNSPVYAEVVVTQGGQNHYFVSSGGQLTITSSSAQRVQGTASFTAVREFGGAGQIQVTVIFDATCFPVPGALACE